MFFNPIVSRHIRAPVGAAAKLGDVGWTWSRGRELYIADHLRHSLSALLPAWEDLEPDRYLPNGARYRARRHARYRFDAATGALGRVAAGYYYQSADVNAAAGGIRRTFGAIEDADGENAYLREIMLCDLAQFASRRPETWSVDVHLVRVVGTEEEHGHPTPEGVHNDGFDFVSFHLISRTNAVGGVSQIFDRERRLLGEAQLSEQNDVLWADDRALLHYTTPIRPKGSAPARRDMLLLSFARESGTRGGE